MEEQDEIRKELENTAPFLSSLKREAPFQVETNYFDSLPGMVMDKIHAGPSHVEWRINWWLQPKRAIAFAACIVLLVSGSLFLWKLNQPAIDRPLPVAEVQKLLNEPLTSDNVIDDVDVEDLVDAVKADELPANQVEPSKDQKNKKAIEKYILDNVDESSLIDAL